MSDIHDYQVDHLLLLVGSNPLPNAVAGKLLIAPGGTITLIHSEDSYDLAGRLKTWLDKAGRLNIHLTEVKASDAASVYKSVQEVLKDDKADRTRIGLHYTGGTKVMSVQAYRALEDWAKKHGRDAIFSYLDAQTLRMCFDPAPGRPANSFYVGLGVDISIIDLLNLHNWEPIKDSPGRTPVLPESATALLTVHNDTNIWVNWLHDELFANARKVVDVPHPFWVYK